MHVPGPTPGITVAGLYEQQAQEPAGSSSNRNIMETNVGGQAVIEGVMMRSPHCLAIAVRQPNGNVVIRQQKWKSFVERHRIFKLPFFRGPVVLVETLVNGIQALNFSASVALEEENKNSSWETILALAVGFILAISFFVILPHYLSYLVGKFGPVKFQIKSGLFHLVDGYFKILFFVLYIVVISFFNDIKRVFQYHGAEHKSIYTFEAGEPLSVENARKYSTLHPRCGTAFILIVLVLSIFVFSAFFAYVPQIPSNSSVARNVFNILVKVLLFIPLAGIAYEVIRFSGKHADNTLLKWVISPGLWLQKLTTREPDDDQLEVALKALETALEVEKNWQMSETKSDCTGGRKE